MKDDEMKGECATNGKEERGIQILVWKPDRRKSL
jgi:hypothetical protein